MLPETWYELISSQSCSTDCMIVPRMGNQAHHVANEIHARLHHWHHDREPSRRETLGGISDMPGLIMGHFRLDEIVNIILPLTRWWSTDGLEAALNTSDKKTLRGLFKFLISKMEDMFEVHDSSSVFEFAISEHRFPEKMKDLPDRTLRLLLLIGLIAYLHKKRKPPGESNSKKLVVSDIDHMEFANIATDLFDLKFLRKARNAYAADLRNKAGKLGDPRLIFTVSHNRTATLSSLDSVMTTKADAAYRLFDISTAKITWAVIDGGVDATHRAFNDGETCRVVQKYDLTFLHRLRNRDLIDPFAQEPDLAGIDALANEILLKTETQILSQDDIISRLENLTHDLINGRPFDWEAALPLIEVDQQRQPTVDHGTHVAGILGGNWKEEDADGVECDVSGMCRDIQLIDMNVLHEDIACTEWAVISALRLVEHLNRRNDFLTVHGVNISLSIPHDVAHYACGRTQVCVDAENLVNNGVVVVAAAGNQGYNKFATDRGTNGLHTTTSITDPGNAEAVITVGSTHRLEPHTYGVSYFSSRGPTGDGRMKPDLVAPGEKIQAPIRGGGVGIEEGTSMAAPHVSGAAAMLMARFEELKGDPARIKKILCESATDLGRERAFQGCGMLDILRALQSV